LEEVRTTSISNRVFTDKPPNPWIIVPIAVVVQPRFVIVVLALKSDRVGQALTLRPFRTLFFYFTPRFVLRAPGELAVGVGQFLWRAQVVALVTAPTGKSYDLQLSCGATTIGMVIDRTTN